MELVEEYKHKTFFKLLQIYIILWNTHVLQI